MIGILCEKPSAARKFAAALGGMQGTYNGEAYVIVNAAGHLYEYKAPDEQVSAALAAKYKSWATGNLPWNETDFSWKRQKKEGSASLLSNIKKVLSGCDEIGIAGDCDPTGEGSLLCWEIIEEQGLLGKKFSRFYFDDEEVPSVQNAFKTRKAMRGPSDDPDYLKALYRSKWDFLSMQFTRIATAYGDGRSVLRQGRLKSAMVLMTGRQLEAVKNYKKVPSYQNRFRDENGNIYTNPEEPVFKTKGEVPPTYKAGTVTVDSKTMKSTAPPKFLDLAALAGRLAPMGFKSKEVLDTYQKMHEQGVVSYPRTEDKEVSPEQFNELLPKIDKIASVVGVDPKLLTHRQPRATHVKTGGSHGANRPGSKVPNSLADLAQFGRCAADIYKLVSLSYLASLAEDYEYEAQKGHVTEYPKFVGSASVPKKMGWKTVFQEDAELAQDDATKALGTAASPVVYEMFPPRPSNPTVSWLMHQLDKNHIGTGATRTSIFAEASNEKAKYPLIKESKGKLTLADAGQMSFLLLPDTRIGDLDITRQVQDEMADIAKHKADPDKCLAQVQGMVIHDIEVMQKNGELMRRTLGKTMNEGGTTMEQKEKFSGTWKGKDVSFNRTYSGHRFTDEECEALCRGEEITVECTGKNGAYKCKGKLSNLTYSGHKYVGFERTGFVNEGGIPKKFCDHVFTEDEMILLKEDKRVFLQGVTSKKGKTFDCYVRYGVKEDGEKGIILEWD